MEQTIEERAYKAVPDILRTNGNYVAAYVCGYCQSAREQKQIDIDKADKWLRTHLPRVIGNYPYVDGTTDMLNEDMRAEFRKAMEK